MKASKMRLNQLYNAPLHRRSKYLSATLSDELRAKYKRRSARIRVGDTVRVMRGEYKGIEGKVIRVHTDTQRIEIEGLEREKTRGEKTYVKIHASKVTIIELNMEDKLRESILMRGKK